MKSGAFPSAVWRKRKGPRLKGLSPRSVIEDGLGDADKIFRFADDVLYNGDGRQIGGDGPAFSAQHAAKVNELLAFLQAVLDKLQHVMIQGGRQRLTGPDGAFHQADHLLMGAV